MLRNVGLAVLALLPVVGLSQPQASADTEPQAQLAARYLGGKATAEQILKAIHKDFAPATMKTGQKTDLNSKHASGSDKAPRDEMVVFFKIAEPAFLPEQLLVLEILSDARDATWARGFFSLIKVDGTGPKVIAREAVVGDESDKEAVLDWFGGGEDGRSGLAVTFELANYKLNDAERAFGYRIKAWDGGTGADRGDETVVLYRRTPQGLARIFNASLASHESEWDNAEDKIYKDVETKAILSVASTMHDGFYDWLVKGKTLDKKRKGGWKPLKVETYVWQNGRYVHAPRAK
jgi:hypothetical protein